MSQGSSDFLLHPDLPGAGAGYSIMDLGDAEQLVAMVTPRGRGTFGEQAREAMSVVQTALHKRPRAMTALAQTVFLRDPGDQAECERILAARYGAEPPVTSFVLQPPCSGAALATEVWAIGGDGVRVERFDPLAGPPAGSQALAVSYGGLRWVYCAGAASAPAAEAYGQTLSVLEQMRSALEKAGGRFERVVRTWFYLGGINEPEEAGNQRYEQLNRARSDFYSGIRFYPSLLPPFFPRQEAAHGRVYPSSTGIGMAGGGLAAGCLAFEAERAGTFLLPLENPLQTPAYDYQCGCSSRSPEFSRAMALFCGNSVITWISGTASIVLSESRHPDDVEKQTEQTIGNIERLISRENFALHGVDGAGARLRDLAAVRVYVKRPEDFERCRAVCERRLHGAPVIYTVADVCRPELLVEIEAVAFSRRLPV
ncbi:MAG: hypothetical protein M0Z58_00275 [Nitrospiraceae bacterium]|nr:hypothetical protein [Nitrospiraceae bacterium]